MSRPSTPRPCGRSPIVRVRPGVDAVRDELEQLPVGADHAQRAVAGADELAGRLHDPLQGAAQVEVGADADDRVQQGPQPLPAGHHLADPVEHLLEQLVEAHPGQRGQPQRRTVLGIPVVRTSRRLHHPDATGVPRCETEPETPGVCAGQGSSILTCVSS